MSEKVVSVSYEIHDHFCIPRNIDLENKKQVKSWYVKWNVLNIILNDGRTIEIQSQMEEYGDKPDLKYPDKQEILDAGDVMDDWNDEKFKEYPLNIKN